MLDLKVKYMNVTIPQIQMTENTGIENIKEELPISNLLIDEWL